MNISPINSVNFAGTPDYKKGKQMFEALSKTEQAGKIGVEMFRQRYNSKTFGHQLPPPEGDLGAYVRLRVSIANAIKKVLDRRK